MTDRTTHLRAITLMGRLARRLAGAADEPERLRHLMADAVEIVPGCDGAGVTLALSRGRLVNGASSDEAVDLVERLQRETEDGPAVEAVRSGEEVVVADLDSDPRWIAWRRASAERRTSRSVVALPLLTPGGSGGAYGALSLYGREPDTFDTEAVEVGRALADHVSVAVAAGREVDQLRTALHHRTIIGQAEGILMERLDIDADRAFDYLSRVSQDSNVKVKRLAADLVRTRTLPRLPG